MELSDLLLVSPVSFQSVVGGHVIFVFFLILAADVGSLLQFTVGTLQYNISPTTEVIKKCVFF